MSPGPVLFRQKKTPSPRGASRDGGARDGGARDGGAKDGGARDGGARASRRGSAPLVNLHVRSTQEQSAETVLDELIEVRIFLSDEAFLDMIRSIKGVTQTTSSILLSTKLERD
jgi:hypothetical protein